MAMAYADLTVGDIEDRKRRMALRHYSTKLTYFQIIDDIGSNNRIISRTGSMGGAKR